MNHSYAGWRALLQRAVRRPFEARQRWRDVSLAQFQAFLREYPRSLEERPRITRKAGHREWMDRTRGNWPANAVAKAWTRGRRQAYVIRSI